MRLTEFFRVAAVKNIGRQNIEKKSGSPKQAALVFLLRLLSILNCSWRDPTSLENLEPLVLDFFIQSGRAERLSRTFGDFPFSLAPDLEAGTLPI